MLLDHLDNEITGIQSSPQARRTRLDYLHQRVDELEGRSRRNNLVFHCTRDARESWEVSESRMKEALTDVIDTLPDTATERAHGIGHYAPSKCRPIIVQFTSMKTKDKALSWRAKLNENDIFISEALSPATRLVRKKLIE